MTLVSAALPLKKRQVTVVKSSLKRTHSGIFQFIFIKPYEISFTCSPSDPLWLERGGDSEET